MIVLPFSQSRCSESCWGQHQGQTGNNNINTSVVDDSSLTVSTVSFPNNSAGSYLHSSRPKLRSTRAWSSPSIGLWCWVATHWRRRRRAGWHRLEIPNRHLGWSYLCRGLGCRIAHIWLGSTGLGATGLRRTGLTGRVPPLRWLRSTAGGILVSWANRRLRHITLSLETHIVCFGFRAKISDQKLNQRYNSQQASYLPSSKTFWNFRPVSNPEMNKQQSIYK